MKIIAFVPDLMDKSRFAPVDAEKMFVKNASDLTEANADDIVVADLSRSGALEILSGLNGPRRVGFASHIDDALIGEAKAAGIEVFPRSRFFSQIVKILAKA